MRYNNNHPRDYRMNAWRVLQAKEKDDMMGTRSINAAAVFGKE